MNRKLLIASAMPHGVFGRGAGCLQTKSVAKVLPIRLQGLRGALLPILFLRHSALLTSIPLVWRGSRFVLVAGRRQSICCMRRYRNYSDLSRRVAGAMAGLRISPLSTPLFVVFRRLTTGRTLLSPHIPSC